MRDTTTATLKRKMGSRLFAAALAAMPIYTKKDARVVVDGCKNRKQSTIKDAIDNVDRLNQYVLAGRANRAQNRKSAHGVPNARPIASRKQRTGRQILRGSLRAALGRAGIRTECSGDYSLSVRIGQPAASGGSYKGDQYSRQCTYRKTNAYHIITVAPGIRQLLKSDMLIVDGLLNIAVKQIGTGEYAATWIKQGRGFEIHAVSGYIVAHPTLGTAHGKTISAARAVIAQRKRARQVAGALRTIEQHLMEYRANGFADLTVRLTDSLRAGNCAVGTEAWIEKHFPGRTEATIRDIIAVEDQHRFVVAACLAAVRRTNKLTIGG